MVLSGEVSRRYLNCSKNTIEEGGAEICVLAFLKDQKGSSLDTVGRKEMRLFERAEYGTSTS